MNVRIFYVLMIVLSFLYSVIWSGLGAANDAAGNSGNRKSNMTWTQRVINEKELEGISKRDMDLSPSASRRLLAKLNARDFDYIAQDIRDGKPIKVPNDFTAFKSWTPLEKYIPDVADLPKFILIVKDVPYIGWYERGKLVGDTYICVGKVDSTTGRGALYRKGKGPAPRVQELSQCLRGACANAMGVEDLRDCLDPRRRHRERALLARLRQPADLSGDEAVRMGHPRNTCSDCGLPGSGTVGFGSKPLQLHPACISVQFRRQSCCRELRVGNGNPQLLHGALCRVVLNAFRSRL